MPQGRRLYCRPAPLAILKLAMTMRHEGIHPDAGDVVGVLAVVRQRLDTDSDVADLLL